MAVQKNAIGVVIQLTITEDSVAVDLSGAGTKQIVLRSPSGEATTKTGSFSTDGTDGKLQYTTVSGDLDEVGFWKAQASLVLSGFTGRSSVAQFEVAANLS